MECMFDCAGCEVSYVEGGHVSATMLHNKTFQ